MLNNSISNVTDVQTKFNVLIMQLCMSSEAMKSVYYEAYKQKMNNILSLDPQIALLKEDEVPPHMREVAILTGYRSPTSSVKHCALSIFIPTNETLNFWTHFIPTFYFMWQLLTFRDDVKLFSDIAYTGPFSAYLVTTCIYPLISALAHTFYSTSDMARHIWFFLDYGALSLYAYGAGLLIKAYVFPQELHMYIFEIIFMESLVFLCILCTILACYSRFLTSLFWIKIFRLGAFALPWIWDSIPVVYRLLHSIDLHPSTREHYYLHFLFSFLIGFFYASHLPERLAPGKFDFLGNSHQLLHMCGIMATHHQMSGALIDMKTRCETMHNRYSLPDYWSIQVFFLMFFSITVTIIIFIFWARHYESKIRNESKREE